MGMGMSVKLVRETSSLVGRSKGVGEARNILVWPWRDFSCARNIGSCS